MTVRIQWRVISRGHARSLEGRFTLEKRPNGKWYVNDSKYDRGFGGMVNECKRWAKDIVEEELDDLKQ